MSEFLPRTEPVAPMGRVRETSLAVAASSGAGTAQTRTQTGAAFDARMTDRSAAAADYARLRADIANVLANMLPRRGSVADAVATAEQSLLGLMPQPVIVLPMPPADPRMVAFVAQVAQSMAQQAARTRAAQANATPIMVEAAAN